MLWQAEDQELLELQKCPLKPVNVLAPASLFAKPMVYDLLAFSGLPHRPPLTVVKVSYQPEKLQAKLRDWEARLRVSVHTFPDFVLAR